MFYMAWQKAVTYDPLLPDDHDEDDGDEGEAEFNNTYESYPTASSSRRQSKQIEPTNIGSRTFWAARKLLL